MNEIDARVQHGSRNAKQLDNAAYWHRIDQVPEDVPVFMGIVLLLGRFPPVGENLHAATALVSGRAVAVRAEARVLALRFNIRLAS